VTSTVATPAKAVIGCIAVHSYRKILVFLLHVTFRESKLVNRLFYSSPESQLGWLNLPHLSTFETPDPTAQRTVKYSSWLVSETGNGPMEEKSFKTRMECTVRQVADWSMMWIRERWDRSLHYNRDDVKSHARGRWSRCRIKRRLEG